MKRGSECRWDVLYTGGKAYVNAYIPVKIWTTVSPENLRDDIAMRSPKLLIECHPSKGQRLIVPEDEEYGEF